MVEGHSLKEILLVFWVYGLKCVLFSCKFSLKLCLNPALDRIQFDCQTNSTAVFIAVTSYRPDMLTDIQWQSHIPATLGNRPGSADESP